MFDQHEPVFVGEEVGRYILWIVRGRSLADYKDLTDQTCSEAVPVRNID